MKRPLKVALAHFAVTALSAPILGVMGITAWTQAQAIWRISHCSKEYSHEQCAATSYWDSKSQVNLTLATWQAWIGVGLVLGATNAALAYWLTQRTLAALVISDQLRPLLPQIERVLAAGHQLTEVLEIYDDATTTSLKP